MYKWTLMVQTYVIQGLTTVTSEMGAYVES